MSLAVVIKGTEGIVLSADSRVSLEAKKVNSPTLTINFDNATKLLSFSEPDSYVGAVTYGMAVIGQRTAHSFIPEFEVSLRGEGQRGKRTQRTSGLSVLGFSKKLSKFFVERWNETMPKDYKGPGMVFIVGGYDKGAAYGKVFLFEIPGAPNPMPRNSDTFGMTWGGQLEVASRIIHGYPPGTIDIIRQTLDLSDQDTKKLTIALTQHAEFPIPYDVLPLQDCIDLATFLIRSTIVAQSLAIGVRGVGGTIEVAVITRTGELKFVQKKQIHGELQEKR